MARGRAVRRFRRARLGGPLGGRTDRGAVSIFVAICAGGLVLVIALVVDAGGKLRLAERVDSYAQEAARVGGQQLDEAALLQGQGYKVQRAYVEEAANSYLRLYGLSTDRVEFLDDGATVEITVRAEYHPVLLGDLGKRKVTGKGRATLVHGVKEAETD
ncbi:pilus assembly protein TadG-related protein [Kitasatospora sp. NPDC056184]|uniref:pilus assembly protein TadG-related protein n=1 Tax=Kitasatospora sp. NPDC056184 TaxID=3345738 RepID=UPI0035D9F783